MRKCINIYSLPRSGTNLFAGYLMQHQNIVSHNVAGGRHPFQANFHSAQHEIYAGAGMHKNYDKTAYFLRDELKFYYIGSKRTWPEQAAFKIYERLFKRLNKRVVLMRNPYAIASSMYDYQVKNSSHRHVWDVSKKDQRIKFVQGFADLLKNSKSVLDEGSVIVDPYLFFTDETMKLRLFDFLDLKNSDMNKIEKCKKGHRFEIVDNQLTCPCGKLEGFGGFNPLLEIDHDRLLTNRKYIDAYFIEELKEELEFQLETKITNCFNVCGITDLLSLEKNIRNM